MATGKFEVKGMNEFSDKLKKLQSAQARQLCSDCAKELAARLLAKVIKRTPVGVYPPESGKQGGTLRRGWTGGTSGAATGYANSLNITQNGNMYSVEITNPVEYASYVEYGHRTPSGRGWVEGQHMLEISVTELQNIAPQVLEAKINKFFQEAFK